MAATAPVMEDMTGTMWRDPNWLAAFPLNDLSVLDYFALSPFYDKSCNNEELRRRGEGIERLAALPPGIEFKLQDAQPPHLFVIRKVLRKSPQSEENVAFYYILDGSIYQAPTLHATLSAKMKKCLHNVRAGFSKMQQDLDPLHKVVRAGASAKEEKARVAAALQPPKEPYSREHIMNVDNIILTVLQKDQQRQAPQALEQASVSHSSSRQ
ncbi:hypothetical protein WJX73_002041 [Symbiochloris irregularis]|uniref:Mediator of RNA polymerase II transcription subunit 6 n=1 Tax=Symbiochloris irregularis TaxID=706552 RepID=A0AAW1NRX5_9CHLO